MRLAIYGGTFDPVHRAHLAVAREAAGQFGLDRVLFVPAGRPPHKVGATHASYADRVRMVELACQGEPRFEVSRLEAGTVRSYSVETIGRVRSQLAPGDELYFVIGADAFADIRTWLRWDEVVRSVRFIVVSRPGHSYEVPEGATVLRLDTLGLTVSSSAIRGQLGSGESPLEVPPAVLAYIQAHGLYRDLK